LQFSSDFKWQQLTFGGHTSTVLLLLLAGDMTFSCALLQIALLLPPLDEIIRQFWKSPTARELSTSFCLHSAMLLFIYAKKT